MSLHRLLSPILGAGLLLAAPVAAQADALETAAPRAANLASGAGWQAWNARDAGGVNRLVVRAPDGTVSRPAIRPFGAPVDPAIGTRGGADGVNTPASRRLSVVYSRCAGPSSVSGCDVYAYDLSTNKEAKVPGLATSAYSETAPSLNFGNWSLVRRGGGPRPGVYSYSERHDRLRRLTSTLARETATSQTRVAFTLSRPGRGFELQIRQSSGHGHALVAAAGLDRLPVSVQLTRYRAGWLVPRPDATHVLQTRRFAGSGGPFTLEVEEAPRTLPAGVTAAAGDASTLFTRYLDPAGVQRIDPAIR
jgi:hypothetical protein